MEIVEGTQWGMLRCETATGQKRRIDLRGGYEEFGDVLLLCRCACGKTKEFWESDVPSSLKNRPQDCGCGIAAPKIKEQRQPGLVQVQVKPSGAGRPRGRTRISISLSLAESTVERTNQYCSKHQTNFSNAVEQIMTAGFAAIEAFDRVTGK